ncbi:hypothetical protein AMTRI_Chr09g35620 [Amborella trichopoda]|uniref:Uncharacterized protein n=1 Tax=Amborella trichopoda TaxID=13333 RepID=W1NLH4_AMBTC|nr:uncharacterized protein LOC18424315 [Amborella trichopoda]ERM96383.1 hypothetical protein AMTR_s00001p00234290 [Amborella trichopoda]|eukprot:XP_006828967.1 uncharacterized protein LOC18424315 [Amborella trichopoda]
MAYRRRIPFVSPLIHELTRGMATGSFQATECGSWFRSCAMDVPNCYHVRSNSLPSKSHPILHQSSEKLLSFSDCDAKHKGRCPVDSLVAIYDDSDDLLRLPFVHEAIRRQHKCVEEILDETIMLMDMCSKMNDAIARVREQQRGALSALRRRDHTALRGQIRACILAQKKTTKALATCLCALRKTYKSVSYHPQHQGSTQDHDVVCALKQMGSITALVYRSLLSRFMTPRKRLSIISTFLKTKLQPPSDGWDCVKLALNALYTSSGKVEELCAINAQNQSESWDECMNYIDNQLRLISNRLIQVRVALLNIQNI